MPNGVCATCPWLIENHGKPHPGGWYKPSNIRRLWNGLRSGAAPGMTCHNTDARPWPETDPKAPKPDVKMHECIGALTMVAREFNAMQNHFKAGGTFRTYRVERPAGFTLRGARAWAERIAFTPGGLKCADPARTAVGMPPTLRGGRHAADLESSDARRTRTRLGTRTPDRARHRAAFRQR